MKDNQDLLIPAERDTTIIKIQHHYPLCRPHISPTPKACKMFHPTVCGRVLVPKVSDSLLNVFSLENESELTERPVNSIGLCICLF